MTNIDDRTAEVPGALDDAAVSALSAWVRQQGIGSGVSDVEPLAGGTQNAADLARLSAAEWRGRPLEQLQRTGSFLARQVPNFLGLLESYRHDRLPAGDARGQPARGLARGTAATRR